MAFDIEPAAISQPCLTLFPFQIDIGCAHLRVTPEPRRAYLWALSLDTLWTLSSEHHLLLAIPALANTHAWQYPLTVSLAIPIGSAQPLSGKICPTL